MPENMARLSETFSKAHEVMDAEKNVVLGKRSLLHSLTSPTIRHHLGKKKQYSG